MKNEQKAIEIAQKHHRIYDDYYDSMQECIDSAREAAEWKQKEMIEKACKWLEENATYTHPRTGTKSCMINLAMFKQAME